MAKISAGSYDLNKWLHGGYELGVVSVIYGPAGTGKTNFCVLASISQAKKGNKVIYVDTEGGFSVERVKQIAESDTERVLKNILLLKPTNFSEQTKDIAKLNKHLKSESQLIVVDSMTTLYRLEFGIARDKGEKEIHKVTTRLVEQMQKLTELARKHNIAVIVTNQVYQWEDESKMVGGDILRYWGRCLIELKNEGGKRTARLVKHRSLPESTLNFQIYNKGIKKKGWI